MPEQSLDGLEPGAGLDEVSGEGVSERARGDVFQDAGLLAGGVEGALDAGGGDRLSGELTLDQVTLWPVGLPAVAQLPQESTTWRSLFPLPRSTRISMRFESTCWGSRCTTSSVRRPEP